MIIRSTQRGRRELPRWPVLNKKHPLALGLQHAWTFSEMGGTIAEDRGIARLSNGTLTNTPTWSASGLGPGLGVVPSQYVNCGDVAVLKDATRISIVAWMYRESGATMRIQKGQTVSSRIHISIGATELYCIVATGAAYYPVATIGATDQGCVAMVFDGSQSTDATRLRAFLNGVEKTLTYGGTVPALTSGNTFGLNVGFGDDAPGYYSTGTFGQVLVYDRAIAPEETAWLTADPAAIWRPATRVVPVHLPDVVTATAANHDPAAGETNVDFGQAISVEWTATSGGNLVSSATISIDGTSHAATLTQLGGNTKRATITGYPLRANRLIALRSTATTADANVNETEWSATTRRAYWGDVTADLGVALQPWIDLGLCDYVVAQYDGTSATTDFSVLDVGLRVQTDNLADYSVQERADGLLAQNETNTVDYLVTEQVYAILAPLGMNTGDFNQNQVPLGSNIQGTEYSPVLLGSAISATEKADIAALGTHIGIRTDHTLAFLGAVIGGYNQNQVPLGSNIDAWFANLLLECLVKSVFQQGAEVSG